MGTSATTRKFASVEAEISKCAEPRGESSSEPSGSSPHFDEVEASRRKNRLGTDVDRHHTWRMPAALLALAAAAALLVILDACGHWWRGPRGPALRRASHRLRYVTGGTVVVALLVCLPASGWLISELPRPLDAIALAAVALTLAGALARSLRRPLQELGARGSAAAGPSAERA